MKGSIRWGKARRKEPIVLEDPLPVEMGGGPMELNFDSTPAINRKHQAVMDVEPCCADDVVLVTRDEMGALEEAYRIPFGLWEDMGSPAKMTVGLLAGDHLNGEGS